MTAGRVQPSRAREPRDEPGSARGRAPASTKRIRQLPGREWRQFTLLAHDSWRRLLASLAFARDADPVPFALWGVTLATTLPIVMSVRKMPAYGFLADAPSTVVMARVLADRLFFLTYAMLASALLAALTWDALFPDRTDQEIVGVLPVRPRTLAAARLTAAAGMAVAFAAAINLPAGLIYSLTASSHPLLGSLPRLLAVHVASTILASMFVFLGLMCARGLVAICAGERIATRLAIVLQLVTVVSFVEVFMFLPGVLPALVKELESSSSGYTLLPPVWFSGLYSWLAEGDGLLLPLAGIAARATALSVVIVTLVSLVSAAWMGRRALETSARERAGGFMAIARLVAALSIRSGPIRGLFLFAIASLARSRRHALVLSTYLGLAIAVSIVKLISASYFRELAVDRASSYMLTVPMVFVFFAVFGLRVAFAIPTDVDANWPLRLSPPSVRQTVSVSRRLLLALAVAPIALAWFVITLALWPVFDALCASALLLVSGVALSEAALWSWTKVPFAAAHEPDASTLRRKGPLYVLALYTFGFILASVQRQALLSPNGTWWYLGAGVAAILVMRLRRERELTGQMPTFDAPDPDGLATMNLSEASN